MLQDRVKEGRIPRLQWRPCPGGWLAAKRLVVWGLGKSQTERKGTEERTEGASSPIFFPVEETRRMVALILIINPNLISQSHGLTHLIMEVITWRRRLIY